MTLDDENDGPTPCDLEQYRRANGLTYEKLRQQLGLSHRRRAMAYALGEVWPDADKLQRIVEGTQGVVSFEGMVRRRLAHLAQTRGLTVQSQLQFAAAAE
jgi:transcriptional regulator with XRE-family HTH domain